MTTEALTLAIEALAPAGDIQVKRILHQPHAGTYLAILRMEADAPAVPYSVFSIDPDDIDHPTLHIKTSSLDNATRHFERIHSEGTDTSRPLTLAETTANQ